MKSNDVKSIYQQALTKWGYSAQLLMAIEECSELIKAICSSFRGRNTNVAEEIADVEIMCKQLRVMYGSDAVDKEKKKKLARLKRRLMSTTNGTFSSK